MVDAKVSVADAACGAEVAEKTVQRWLKGRAPHERHRWTVAKMVEEDEAYLWPRAELRLNRDGVGTAELVEAYAHRAAVPRSTWTNIIDDCRQRVGILAYAAQFLPELYPALGARLVAKAQDGCKVRIVLGDPDSPEIAARDAEEGLSGGMAPRIRSALHHLSPCVRSDLTEVRMHRTPLYNSVFHFDDQILYTPHMYRQSGYESPLLHLRRVAKGGIFDNVARHFERVWEDAVPLKDGTP